jgi:hypothetical protein
MADKASAVATKHWIEKFCSERTIIPNGYYVTRLPSSEQNMTVGESQIQEQRFFDKDPWRLEDKDRLGTENLVLAVSERLSRMITTRLDLNAATNPSLPTLKATILRHRDDCRRELQNMGTPASDGPQSALLHLCQAFITKIKRETTGHEGRFYSKILSEFENFKVGIEKTEPEFILRPENPEGLVDVANEGGDDATDDRSDVTYIFEGIRIYTPLTSGQPVYLGQIRRLIQRKRRLELKGIIPWDAWVRAMTVSAPGWPGICLALFEKIVNIARNFLEKVAGRMFRKFETHGFHAAVMYFPGDLV